MTLIESSIVNATDINGMQMTAIVDDEDHKVIEMDLDVVYEGTETSDVFTVQAMLRQHKVLNFGQ